MGYSATWKVLQDLMIDLSKKGVTVHSKVVEDLRNAKLMIQISETPGAKGELTTKVDEFLGNVESLLLADAQKTLGNEYVDEWLKRIDEASIQCATCVPSEPKKEENKFVTGVPRDQKWVRVEPYGTLTPEHIEQLAKENSLLVKSQNDGRLLVHGLPENVKTFIKKMTAETTKK
jgi:hypothetical protein